MRDISMECDVFFDVTRADDQYKLSDFIFENLDLKVKTNPDVHIDYIDGFTLKNVKLNGKRVEN